MFDAQASPGYARSMRSLILPGLFVMLMITTASARLGETLDECLKRYGPSLEKRPALLKVSDPETLVFTKAGITVAIEFRQGKAWQVTFRKPGLNRVELDAILMANAGSGSWSPPLKTRDKEYRMTDDKGRVAVINWDRKGMAGSLTIMSRDFAAANRAEIPARVEAANGPASRGSTGNPLPGF